MSETSDPPAESDPPDDVTARVTTDDVSVRKVASPHGPDAIAVYFTIQSIRDDRCTVRIADAIPEPLRGNDIEFHPRYDPVNWTHADGTVVYAATVPPDANRTTVYGVTVDDPADVELFGADPAVEVFEDDAPEEYGGAPTGDDDETFDFGAENELDAVDEGSVSDPSPEPATDVDDADLASVVVPEADTRAADEAAPDPIAALVDELDRRDLTDEERRALRDAIGVEGAAPADDGLDALRAEVESLRQVVASVDREAVGAEEFEAVTRAVEDRYDSLAADLAAVESTLEREVEWRQQLRRSLEADPDSEL